MSGSHRPRRVLLETLTSSCEELRNGIYTVKRTPINWTSWNFNEFPRGIAILQDQGSLFPSASTGGMRPSLLSIEIFAKLPEASEVLGTDEAVSEELLDDVEDVLYELVAASYQGEPVVFNLNLPSVNYTEHHDAHVGVQGFVFTFQVTY